MRIILSVVIVVGLLSLSPAAPASLETSRHWSIPAAELLAEMEILHTPPPAPDAPLDTGNWVVWLCRTAAWPSRGQCTPDAPAAGFLSRAEALAQSVPLAPARYQVDGTYLGIEEHPMADVLKAATIAGLIRGDPGGDLAPDRLLTAAEGLTIVSRLLINRQEATPWQLEPDQQRPLDRLRLLLHPELVGPHRSVRVARSDGREIAARVRWAETWVARMVGAESGLGDGLILVNTSAIHTRWGSVPLDVLFLDESGTVVGAFPALPRNVTRGVLGAQFALELPGGRIEALGLRVGDDLVFESLP